MSVDLSKIGYGVIFDPATNSGGVVVSKIGYGVIFSLSPGALPDFVDSPDEVYAPSTVSYILKAFPLFIDSLSLIFEPDLITVTALIIPDRERNPYPAHIPNRVGLEELTDFLGEQQRIIRQQHNLTQAGDSTFDYGLLLKGYTTQQYTLGAIGRFYHDDYGLILAHYVQFDKMQNGLTRQGVPVGRIVNTTQDTDWVVTNDFDKSGADLVMGMIFIAESPADGTFGWMVTHGPNPAACTPATPQIPVQNDPYSWTGTGQIGLSARGRVIARRWGKAFTSAVAPGQIFVALEGLSPADLVFAIEEATVELSSQITNLDGRITSNTTNITALRGDVTTLQTLANSLQNRLNTETGARIRDIASIRAALGSAADWSSAILTGDNLVRAEFAAADDAIRITANNAKTAANNAMAILTSLDVAGLSYTVGAVQTSLLTLIGRITSFSTDLITVPPTVGQGLIYDIVNGVFVPTDVVLSVVPGTGIDVDATDPGNPIVTLEDTAVTPGIYTKADVTVDQQGRITAVANGAPDIDTSLLVDAVDDTAAATAGVGVGEFYRNGSVMMVRVT